MFKLYGFLASNYVQMVHFVLLEKDMGFEIIPEMPTQERDFKTKSAMGKVPVLETEHGFLTEANVIMEYLEDLQPSPSLLPSDPFERARVRELMKECELYVELAARRNYPELFYGGERSEEGLVEAKRVLENAVSALKQLGKFDPYIAGAEFTLADIVAAYSFCYATTVTQALYDWDIVADVPGLQGALDATHARPAGQIVAASQQAGLKDFAV